MSASVIILIVVFLLLGICLILGFTLFFIKKTYHKRRQYVFNNSKKISRIKILNNEYENCFFNIEEVYEYNKRFDRKSLFDNTTTYDYLRSVLRSDVEFFDNLLDKVRKNKQLALLYMNRFNVICNSITNSFEYKWCHKLEEKLIKEMKLKYVDNISIKCNLSYVSPKGRNSYNNKNIFDIDDIVTNLDRVKSDVERKNQYQSLVKKERQLMTNSLRYDILKRDNFRCVICGATAMDGVKLHVDHIVPISKGGLTIESNLRTLCDRCNLGKSDKIE